MLVNEYRLEIQFKKVRKVRNIHERNLRGLWWGWHPPPPQGTNHPDWQGNYEYNFKLCSQADRESKLRKTFCALKASKYVSVCWPR